MEQFHDKSMITHVNMVYFFCHDFVCICSHIYHIWGKTRASEVATSYWEWLGCWALKVVKQSGTKSTSFFAGPTTGSLATVRTRCQNTFLTEKKTYVLTGFKLALWFCPKVVFPKCVAPFVSSTSSTSSHCFPCSPCGRNQDHDLVEKICDHFGKRSWNQFFTSCFYYLSNFYQIYNVYIYILYIYTLNTNLYIEKRTHQGSLSGSDSAGVLCDSWQECNPWCKSPEA